MPHCEFFKKPKKENKPTAICDEGILYGKEKRTPERKKPWFRDWENEEKYRFWIKHHYARHGYEYFFGNDHVAVINPDRVLNLDQDSKYFKPAEHEPFLYTPFWVKMRFYEARAVNLALPEITAHMAASYDPRLSIEKQEDGNKKVQFDNEAGLPITVTTAVPNVDVKRLKKRNRVLSRVYTNTERTPDKRYATRIR